jgi:hypothetical protein
MQKFYTIFVCFFTSISFTDYYAQEAAYVPGELIIQFKEKINVEEFNNAYTDIQMEQVRLLSERMNIWLFEYNPAGADAVETKFRISRNPLVKVAQFNHYITMRGETGPNNYLASDFANFPNDPMFSDQWGLHNTGQSGGTPDADIDAPEAWDISTGGITALGDTIVVAVIDGGCQLNHPDLNYWYNWQEIPNNGIDDDNNGYIDDHRGWNAYNNSGNIPGSSHGTHVSGITCAIGNNGIGVSGANWDARVMPIAGSTTVEAIAVAAYAYALELRATYNETNGLSGAFIVATNSSFGVDLGQPANYPIWCAMYDSMGVQGILSCGATANEDWDIDVVGDVPTACPSDYMIAVTNTTRNDVRNSSAAYGLTTIDLGAPGTSILSTNTGSGYSYKTGTSMATPMVAGSIALMFAAANSSLIVQYKNNLSLGAITFRDMLFEAVDSNASLQGITVTGGRLNVYNAALLASNFIVPVELVSMSAENTENGVLLTWITATETNNHGFEIEKLFHPFISGDGSLYGEDSEDGHNWNMIGFVGGSGTTTENKFYSFIDDDIKTGFYNYRLKQMDYDGRFEYSDIVEVEVPAPNEFSLLQNFPNPFNPSTKIKFTVPLTVSGVEGSLVTLKVYDVLGNEIVTLVNEEKPAGSYEVEFSAAVGLPSGVYFYRLQVYLANGGVQDFTSIKKMLLIK